MELVNLQKLHTEFTYKDTKTKISENALKLLDNDTKVRLQK